MTILEISCQLLLLAGIIWFAYKYLKAEYDLHKSIPSVPNTSDDVNNELEEELRETQDALLKSVEMYEDLSKAKEVQLDCPCGLHRQPVQIDVSQPHQDYTCSRCNKRCGIKINILTTQIPQGETLENYPLITQVGTNSKN